MSYDLQFLALFDNWAYKGQSYCLCLFSDLFCFLLVVVFFDLAVGMCGCGSSLLLLYPPITYLVLVTQLVVASLLWLIGCG